MKKLLLTLGHNASAILVEDNEVLIGYEEERLSGVKADSSFPKLAINEILKFYPDAKHTVDTVYISHWFWEFSLSESKYYLSQFISTNFTEAKVVSADYYNTHHDLHAKSVWNFCEGDNSGLTIIADGFGNCGECLSIYDNGILKYRSYSLIGSLGLMYQYATSYLGMKENQDEYKLLGYELLATREFKDNIENKIVKTTQKVLDDLFSHSAMLTNQNTMVDKLFEVKEYWHRIFRSISTKREEIAYFVQSVLERVIYHIISTSGAKNIKVSGGVFYNVKLNNMIMRYADSFEANPLSGDQGCALGFTDVRYNDLFWGKRSIDGLIEKQADTIINDILEDGYSEIFEGNMEFGPRALGHTTCLALPTMELVNEINSMNGRNTVMPMAPMVSDDFISMFKDTDKVSKSKEFMITSFDYVTMNDSIRGAAHYDADRDVYTGRIQLVKGGKLKEVLNYFGGILINTSLNAHGQPIIYDMQDYKNMKIIQGRQNGIKFT